LAAPVVEVVRVVVLVGVEAAAAILIAKC